MHFIHPNSKQPLPFFLSSLEESRDLRILRLKGNIDREVIPEAVKFKKTMRNLPDYRLKCVLFDFKEVTDIDSAAIAELIEILAELKEENHQLGVINLTDEFRAEFQIMRVDKILTEYPTEREAIKALNN